MTANKSKETRQKRYHQTSKGKTAQRKAIANYKSRMVRWDLLLSPELSMALDRARPKEASRASFARHIFGKYLDSVAIPDID